MASPAKRLAIRYRQKGKKRRKRQKQYRQTKSRSKARNKVWRKTHTEHLKRYRRKKKQRPNYHRLKRRAALELTLAEQAPFWDLETDQEGEVEAILPDDEQVKTRVDGEERVYNLFDFLDQAALMDEKTEDDLFKLLDQLYEGDEDEPDEAMAERVALRYARKKLPKSVLITAVVQFRHKGKLVIATVERTNWLGGDKMMYYWKTTDGQRVETLGLPDDIVILDKGR
jgi:hypothetical protein